MNYTALIFGFRECSWYGFFHSGKTIRTQNKDIFNTTAFQFIKYRQPVFWDFIISYVDSENIFLSFSVYSKDYIGCKFTDYAFFPNGIVYSVYEYDRVYPSACMTVP